MLTLSITPTESNDEETGIVIDQIMLGNEESLTIADASSLPAANITLDTDFHLPPRSYDPRDRIRLPRAQREQRLHNSGNRPFSDIRQNVPIHNEVCNDMDQGVVGEEGV